MPRPAPAKSPPAPQLPQQDLPWLPEGGKLLHSSTHPFIHSSTHPLIHLYTHPHSSTHSLIHSSTHPLIHSSTQPLIHSAAQPIIHAPTHPIIHSALIQLIHSTPRITCSTRKRAGVVKPNDATEVLARIICKTYRSILKHFLANIRTSSCFQPSWLVFINNIQPDHLDCFAPQCRKVDERNLFLLLATLVFLLDFDLPLLVL